MNKAAKAAIKELRDYRLEQIRLESLKRERDMRYSKDCEQIDRIIGYQEQKIALIEGTLKTLSPTEQRILNASYIRQTESMADIMFATHYSDAQINRIKYSALNKYAYARGLDIC